MLFFLRQLLCALFDHTPGPIRRAKDGGDEFTCSRCDAIVLVIDGVQHPT